MKHPVSVCSWSFQKPIRDVAEEMARLDVRHVHLALQPFLEGDARHGHAEDARTRGYVEGLIDAGAWTVSAAMLSFPYEDYTTPATIRKTGGIVPDAHWEANRKLIREAAALAKQFRTPYLTLHAGYLDEKDAAAVAKFTDRVKFLADVCGENGLQLLLETGQETADDLVRFLGTVKGVGVNFDPANMLLYGMGDPVAAVTKLAPWIRHVHAKDALPSPQPGVAWGEEVPWGEGRVNAAAFLAALDRAGYAGAIAVEREGGASRAADIARAVKRLRAS
ncbi:MAG: sugar phosphate isomerase/epimerase [Kiritimatiellae bacterium]|nr:sugar phosphate isomerase/epimerase [Kiritimatiellia bacterium]